MKSAEDRLSSELAVPLARPMARRILTQGQMRSEFVVVAGVGRKDSAQIGLTEDDDVIEAFPPDRADRSQDDGWKFGQCHCAGSTAAHFRYWPKCEVPPESGNVCCWR